MRKEYRFALLMLCVFSILTGCVSYPKKEKAWIEGFKADESFTSQSIAENRIALVGVAGQYSNISSDDVTVFNDISKYYLTRYLGGDALIDAKQFEHEVGAELVENLLKHYSVDSSLLYLPLADIESMAKVSRYAAFYKIKDNEVVHDQHRYGDRECFYSARKMVVHFEVYDLLAMKSVWGGDIEKELTDKNCNARTKSKNDNFAGAVVEIFVGSLIDATFDAVLGTYPEAPDIQNVFAKAASGFAENMPGAYDHKHVIPSNSTSNENDTWFEE